MLSATPLATAAASLSSAAAPLTLAEVGSWWGGDESPELHKHVAAVATLGGCASLGARERCSVPQFSAPPRREHAEQSVAFSSASAPLKATFADRLPSPEHSQRCADTRLPQKAISPQDATAFAMRSTGSFSNRGLSSGNRHEGPGFGRYDDTCTPTLTEREPVVEVANATVLRDFGVELFEIAAAYEILEERILRLTSENLALKAVARPLASTHVLAPPPHKSTPLLDSVPIGPADVQLVPTFEPQAEALVRVEGTLLEPRCWASDLSEAAVSLTLPPEGTIPKIVACVPGAPCSNPSASAGEPLPGGVLRLGNSGQSLESDESPMHALRSTIPEYPKYERLRGSSLRPESPEVFASKHLLNVAYIDSFMGVVILLNAITIGVEVVFETSGRKVPLVLDVSEKVFCGFYVAELFLRFTLEGFWQSLRTWRVIFDMFLVALSLFDVGVEAFAEEQGVLKELLAVRLLRLARITRVVRLIQLVPELALLVHALVNSCTMLVWTFLVMFVLIYIFSIIGLESVRYDPEAGEEFQICWEDNFSSLDRIMLSLWQMLTFDDSSGIYRPVIEAKPMLGIYFVVFMLLGSVALMNLVTALMVDSCVRQAQEDKRCREATANARRAEKMPRLKEIFAELDVDKSGTVELVEILGAPRKVQDEIACLVDLDEVEDIFLILDVTGTGALDIDTFCEGILKASCGSKPLELTCIINQCAEIVWCSRELLRRFGTIKPC
eukprot:TRINITY_DN51519_c0_g1_i1.p1 TRINITY_DN51519_c0_g1~~TRINITY_DN51519_c0_g1_i1.p1  ORF type:complete len:728 (-),score=114.57 TRINITY_DN51519_c0_g1_i1:115-2298(-)